AYGAFRNGPARDVGRWARQRQPVRHRTGPIQEAPAMTIVQPDIRPFDDLLTQSALYRDIHKGIRADLFALTEEAGRIDPSCREDRVGVAAHVRSVVDLLVTHAAHEDGHIKPVL